MRDASNRGTSLDFPNQANAWPKSLLKKTNKKTNKFVRCHDTNSESVTLVIIF